MNVPISFGNGADMVTAQPHFPELIRIIILSQGFFLLNRPKRDLC